MIRALSLFTLALWLMLSQAFSPSNIPPASPEKSSYFSAIDLAVDSQNGRLHILGKTACELRSYKLNDLTSYTSFFTDLPAKSVSMTDDYLLVACSHSEGFLLVLDKTTLKEVSTIAVGHGACDAVVSKDQSTAYVANQFSDDISVVDLGKLEESGRIKVLRQPKQIELSLDGRYLFAANFLPAGRADKDTVSSSISVIDLQKGKCIKEIPLANGSNALRGMCVSADGMHLLITHNLGRFQVPTSQLEQGWMNTNALSIIHVPTQEFVATVLLDETDHGAAGSWGIDCNEEHIYVAHSGTHDFSKIDYPAMILKLSKIPDKGSLAYDLSFLKDIRTRIKVAGNGPRAIITHQNKVFVANYFSDNLNVLEGAVLTQDISLSDNTTMNEHRKGEQYFNDATFCFQSWQSCTGCHPDDARTDGLNWDLLNDGMGNPRNCKSLLLAHVTAPSMITGIRPNAEIAVRAGFEYIQFMQVDDSVTTAVDAYLKSLQAIPSPHLEKGSLSQQALMGKKVFEEAGCAECHPGPHFTDLKKHSMGTLGAFDRQNSWDTPSLIEIWRTGPFLHDGRCATLEEVFTREEHGLENPLPKEELEQLISYLLSI